MTTATAKSRDLELLYELGALRFIDRTWVQFHRPNVANVAEHTLRVVWIAQLLARREQADIAKTTQMALVHDIGKSRAGDAHWLNRKFTRRDQGAAVAATMDGTWLESEVTALFAEFMAGESLEAKIVKDADNLDVDLEFRERYDDWAFARAEVDVRRSVYEHKLHTQAAKALWLAIQESDPHRWYTSMYEELKSTGQVGAAEA